MSPTVAILLKAPTAGAVKTRLAATVGTREAARIYRLLAERQLRAVPADWSAAVHYAPAGSAAEMRRWLAPLRADLRFTPQSDGNLGRRIAAAFAAEFARGACGVIAVGGDCPRLDESVLREARRALATVDVVLGPATDGGYYLIGLRQPRANLFAGVAWSTPEVLPQTRAKILAESLSVAELRQLDDVDDEAGWHRAVAADRRLPQRRRGDE